jgi:single-strand DNA-binding protein
MNNYNCIGRLCSDPETHETANNTVAKIRIAINGRKKEGDNWVDDPTFLTCEAWGNQADFISKHFEKGKEIWIQGELKIDEWEKDGQKRSAPKIKIRTCGFTSGKANGNKDGDDFV